MSHIRKLHLLRSFSTNNYHTQNIWNDPCILLNKKSLEIQYTITYPYCHSIDLCNQTYTCNLHGHHRIRSNSPHSHCKGTLYRHQGHWKNDHGSPGSSPQNTAEMKHINLLDCFSPNISTTRNELPLQNLTTPWSQSHIIRALLNGSL